MSKIELEIVSLSSNQPQTGSFALVLGEIGGNRRLPIIIGHSEAHAIAIENENLKTNRPMTHDLFKSFAHAFSYIVEEIVITDLREGIFFAKIVCSDKDKRIEIDSRPSDAIAIGVRFKVPLYVLDTVLSEGGIEVDDNEEIKPERGVKPSSSDSPSTGSGSHKKLEDTPLDKLNEMMDKALEQEEYEKAAKIRDEINRRN